MIVEAARRHAVAGLLACAAGFALILVLAYWVGPAERLDRDLLDAVATPTDTLVNEVAYAGFQVVDFRPTWVLVGAIAFLIAMAQWRLWDAVLAAALMAGTGALVLGLKALLSNPRYQPVPIGSDAYPWEEAFPSGHAAGSLAMSLAFLSVVPPSWRRPAAIAGVVFTLYISLGVVLLNYHYPGDVPAGWLLAAGWWFALLALIPASELSGSETRDQPPGDVGDRRHDQQELDAREDGRQGRGDVEGVATEDEEQVGVLESVEEGGAGGAPRGPAAH
jgi:membrane-associated phospholipid phosphatase